MEGCAAALRQAFQGRSTFFLCLTSTSSELCTLYLHSFSARAPTEADVKGNLGYDELPMNIAVIRYVYCGVLAGMASKRLESEVNPLLCPRILEP